MAPKKQSTQRATPKRATSADHSSKSSSKFLTPTTPTPRSKSSHAKAASRSSSSRLASHIPPTLHFPVLLVLSLAVSSLLYFFASPLTSGDLAKASAHREQWWQIGGFIVWRAAELALGWWEGYDTIDEASLILLSHLPFLFFLTSFYKIRPTTASLCLAIDLFATAAPFAILRSFSAAHQLKSPRKAVANPSLVTDKVVQAFISLLATGIYSVIVYGSFRTWMPVWLVTHFPGMRDISTLYTSTFIWLCAALLPTGFAAKTFLFTPAAAAKPDAYDKKRAAFNAEFASFWETVEMNTWGRSKRVRVMARRVVVLATCVGVHTWLQTYLVVDGAEGFGAAGWAGIWTAAALVTGVAYSWVLDID